VEVAVRPRRQRGFTLIELVVSTAILMLVMLIALQMLAEAGRLFSSAQVELTEPSVRLATQWLRRDIQGASALGRLAFLATSGPLELRGHQEGTIRYERVGANLDRVTVAVDGREIGRRTVLRGVSGWQWRALNSGLVEVEIVYQRRAHTQSRRPGGSPSSFEVLSERRWFALRGRQRRSW
jgi:prepilin-type N-terminal cleavage/methylation domain-containing protein